MQFLFVFLVAVSNVVNVHIFLICKCHIICLGSVPV